MILPQWRGYMRIGNMPAAISKLAVLCAITTFAILLYCWHVFGFSIGPSFGHSGTSPSTNERYWSVSGNGHLEGLATWEKPKGLNRIVALVFYGRPASVSILDCYLKRNLIKNGGMLDEVIFIARTKSQEDLAWLDVLLTTEPAYSRMNITFDGKDYRSAYDSVENGTMYIKIDDDIVFIEDSVIPTIAFTKMMHPEYYVVSANIMNQPSLSWVHYHLGAVKPYLPEIRPPKPSLEAPQNLKSPWRASELPVWDGPEDFNMTHDWKSLYDKHRWLPLRPESTHNIDDTPIVHTAYDAFSNGLWHWTIAAQEHYSFFENLENNELYKYKFESWDYNFTRMGIQFVAMMGEDINLAKPMESEDDEYYFSEVMPAQTGRHAIVDGRAIAAHYSFEPQREGIASTDILERYRMYANEYICV